MHDDGIYDPTAGIRGGAGNVDKLDKTARLPGLNDAYKAAGTAENHEVSRLVVIMGKDGFRPGGTAYYFFQYVHLSLGEFGFTANGQRFSFMVADLQPKLITVHGRDLLRYADHITLRRLPWIRQADRDLRPVDGGTDNEPIITHIEVEDWVRPLSPAEEPALQGG